MNVLDGLGEENTVYRAHFNTVTKENNLLKKKIENLEGENRRLKHSVFDLTSRLAKLESLVGSVRSRNVELHSDRQENDIVEDKASLMSSISKKSVVTSSPKPFDSKQSHFLDAQFSVREDDFSFPKLGEFQCKVEIREHKGAVYCVSWSNKGDLLASGDLDKTVIISNTLAADKPGKSTKLQQHSQLISDAKWSCEDSKFFSASFDHCIYEWDVGQWGYTNIHSLHSLATCLETHSKDPSLLFAGDDKSVIYTFDTRISSPANTAVLYSKNGKKAKVNTIHSLRGEMGDRYIYIGDSKGYVSLWDIRSLKPVERFGTLVDSAQRPISHISSSPALSNSFGRLVAVNSYDNLLRVYSSKNLNSELSSFNGDTNIAKDEPHCGLDFAVSVKGHRVKNWPIKCSFSGVLAKQRNSKSQTRKSDESLLLATGSATHSAYVFLIQAGSYGRSNGGDHRNSPGHSRPRDNGQQPIDPSKPSKINTGPKVRSRHFAKLKGHTGKVYSCEFNPSSENPVLATASADATVRVW
eukprot:CAMPEP_0184008016 /NCGR_PEP_ID=MMETSP0954-20121128/1701_1 /TAXON_ID=627963 /ORGANISM="Aplanochytrium sp, Strain PBS07" /LENGTH=524 /DNA_ID=CAMNT_0026287003 /DNA_START=151 /DNA_END=1722 /DNA_ORIENTATION=+